MNKKLILTSLVAMSIALPALATETETNFPQSGYMSPDTRYTGAATEDNMAGVYEENDSVYAVAEYGNTTFNINVGKYLPANSETGAVCLSGYFCPGGQLEYSETTPDGLESCPDGFGSSDSGASRDTQCYRTCNSANMGTGQGYTIAPIAHADSITGRDYYGSGTDTCVPSSCVHGWHIKNMNPGMSGSSLSSNNENSVCVSSAYINSGNNWIEYRQDGNGNSIPNAGMTYYGMDSGVAGVGEWVVEYNGYMEDSQGVQVYKSSDPLFVYGVARCSSIQGDNNSNAWSNPTKLTTEQMAAAESGTYCYCHLTGYRQSSGSSTFYDLSSPWVYEGVHSAECLSNCANKCVQHMAFKDSVDFAFRRALFSSATPGVTYCEANTIKVKWYGTTAAAVSANNAGTVTYGGDIVTPTSYTPITGKRFKGWRFSSEEPAGQTPANPD